MTNTIIIEHEPYDYAAYAKLGVFGYFFVLTIVSILLLVLYVILFRKKHGPEVTVVKMA
ncbi:two tm domain protein [Entamoeba histolytica]|uniref:Two tm domain protein n=2 Tax=Entamoeba TaxID=5758 RepID=A0A175JG59_ENTHI|nr:two tm domain protein [Entamoeba histolytica]